MRINLIVIMFSVAVKNVAVRLVKGRAWRRSLPRAASKRSRHAERRGAGRETATPEQYRYLSNPFESQLTIKKLLSAQGAAISPCTPIFN
ncbi:hypothetical protein [Trinickia fusca]|uniref:hypothetical protein n=1 Tax=Trinickia fusca TaxID=2419777 RepID=UPI0011C47856|nr:hypothetical protein [Trinickia fusca]